MSGNHNSNVAGFQPFIRFGTESCDIDNVAEVSASGMLKEVRREIQMYQFSCSPLANCLPVFLFHLSRCSFCQGGHW